MELPALAASIDSTRSRVDRRTGPSFEFSFARGLIIIFRFVSGEAVATGAGAVGFHESFDLFSLGVAGIFCIFGTALRFGCSSFTLFNMEFSQSLRWAVTLIDDSSTSAEFDCFTGGSGSGFATILDLPFGVTAVADGGGGGGGGPGATATEFAFDFGAFTIGGGGGGGGAGPLDLGPDFFPLPGGGGGGGGAAF